MDESVHTVDMVVGMGVVWRLAVASSKAGVTV